MTENRNNIRGIILSKFFDRYCEDVISGITFRQANTLQDVKHLKERIEECIESLTDETVESAAFDANGVFINIEAILYESENLYLLDFKYSDETIDVILGSSITLYNKDTLEPFKINGCDVIFKPVE